MGISRGKELPEYREATGVIELNAADMERCGLTEGSGVTLRSEHGFAEVRCRRGQLPEGLAFMAFGSACNRLVGDETSACGMPDSKHVRVEIAASTPPPASGATDAREGGKP